MDAPAVQFATTSDGMRIACCESGSGPDVVLLPLPFNNLSRMWQMQPGRRLFSALVARYHLYQYDPRGTGLSSRGLPESHVYESYQLDIEAVIDHFAVERAVLFAGLMGGHIAVRYAVSHPDRVQALILLDVNADAPLNRLPMFEDLAAGDWEAFLTTISDLNRNTGNSPKDFYREAIDQQDFVKMVRSARHSNIRELLPRVACPTLVIAVLPTEKENITIPTAQVEELAATIPDARLAYLPGRLGALYSYDDSDPPVVPVMETFLRSIGLPPASPSASAEPELSATALTERETEILRFIAAGKTNQEIADELVLSVRTVERHINHIYDKLGVSNRAQATAYALKYRVA